MFSNNQVLALVALLAVSFPSALVRAEEVLKIKLDAKSGSSAHGLILLKAVEDGVSILGEIGGLKPGTVHGFHVHEIGDCSGKDGSTAGGHWNPDQKKHGDARMNHPQSHAGDLGNVTADSHGVAKIDIFMKGYRLVAGDLSLKGRSIVVHEDPDDFKTQPSGNSGKRIACGAIH